ncbi:molybdopterin molybdenumtransferase MoeA [Romboutsia ilealis]|uniref:Molybdopterin molybdenumtransferase n=1 Tax=Romboutsia faecis TaxID=2764597 RepID=A0ABR7JLD6_9FIRM|nr:molybdopterin molybdotransferase MoeA [Romboutsia faecis]MBC5995734.1 molybdopterin molybdotransferase MoeA [Romboutsia faecis]MRN23935.1 molybdopterin molybdenumtransferase MoeA [Romboutsia ilealis]
MIEVKDAIKVIKSNLKPKEDTKTIDIINSINMVSAQDIYSPIDNPPFDRSPYDGYAYDANINRNELTVVGEIYAGEIFKGVLHRNESVKIMTGAKIPNGANCVIKKEDVSVINENKIIVNKNLKMYDNYIFKGEDIPKNQLIIRKGDIISYESIGILASLGIKEISVYDNLKIGILNTGTEIQELDEILEDGKIFDSNRYILHSRLLKRNIEPVIIDKVEDEIEELESKIKNILKNVDILITTGGVSVGDKDLVPKAFKNLGGKELFWKVKAKPGGACCASVLDEKLLFGLSGSPHASGVVYENILVPVIEYMSHKDSYNTIKAIFKGNFNKKAKIDRYLNGRLYTEDAKLYVEMTDKKDAKARLWATLNSNCMIKVKKGSILEDDQLVEVVII